MKSIWRKLSALLVIVLIIGTMAVPAAAADSTTIRGGTTRANATELKFGKYYTINIRSSQTIAYFKFKTRSYYAQYHMWAYHDKQKNIRGLLQNADGSTIYTDTFNEYATWGSIENLKPNTWYYIVLKNSARISAKIELDVSCHRDEDRDSKGTAVEMRNARTLKGNIFTYFDKDYYKFVPTQTGDYKVTVRCRLPISWCDALYASFSENGGRTLAKKTIHVRNNTGRKPLNKTIRLTRGKTYFFKLSGGGDSAFIGEDGEGIFYQVRVEKQ